MPQIKYIGKKEFFPDFVAQSGKSWNGYGDVQEVTDDQAKKLLVHDDEFAEKGAHDALLAVEQAEQDALLAEQEAARAALLAAEQAALLKEADANAAPLANAEQPVVIPEAPADSGLADAAPKQPLSVSAAEISAMNKTELTALAAANGIEINPAAPVAALRKQLIAALITA